jgi:hypothetical protein
MSVSNYSVDREYTGILRDVGGERTVPLINEKVHPDNQVRVYKAWRHNVEDCRVLAVKIEQKGGADINSVYVVRDGEAEEISYGWSRSGGGKPKKTKDDVLEDTEEWMRNHPNGGF